MKRFAQTIGLNLKARIRFVGHHLAHSLSAYAYSGFDDAAVVVMDGRGAMGGDIDLAWAGRAARARFDDSVSRFDWILL